MLYVQVPPATVAGIEALAASLGTTRSHAVRLLLSTELVGPEAERAAVVWQLYFDLGVKERSAAAVAARAQALALEAAYRLGERKQ